MKPKKKRAKHYTQVWTWNSDNATSTTAAITKMKKERVTNLRRRFREQFRLNIFFSHQGEANVVLSAQQIEDFWLLEMGLLEK